MVAVLPPERVARLEVPPRDVRGAGGGAGRRGEGVRGVPRRRSGASWRPQGLAAAASLGTAAWAATALAFGVACREIHDAAAAGPAGAARGWRMRALEGLTVTLAFTQLLYVLLLHAAVAGERCGLACAADA